MENACFVLGPFHPLARLRGSPCLRVTPRREENEKNLWAHGPRSALGNLCHRHTRVLQLNKTRAQMRSGGSTHSSPERPSGRGPWVGVPCVKIQRMHAGCHLMRSDGDNGVCADPHHPLPSFLHPTCPTNHGAEKASVQGFASKPPRSAGHMEEYSSFNLHLGSHQVAWH